MTLIVVRHGRTATNVEGRLLGRSDPPLDDTGEAQALALATALGPLPPTTRVIASPLVRTRQTAAVIAGESSSVEVDERWIELDYGELDGTPLSEVPPATWTAWQGDVDWAPPGGESHATLGKRVRAACDELAAAPAGAGDVLVVSHVSPIKAAVAWALAVGDAVAWHLFLSPGSITRIAPRGTRHSLQSFNETAHLR